MRPFSGGVTKYGRVWRKVPESEVWSEDMNHAPLQWWRDQVWQSLEEGARKCGLECGMKPSKTNLCQVFHIVRHGVVD